MDDNRVSRPSADIVGQYASDQLFYGQQALDHDPFGIKATRGDGNPALHHDETLFDAVAGLWDPATGNVLRDPTQEEQEFGGEDMRIQPDTTALARLTIAQTAADAWMRQNGHSW